MVHHNRYHKNDLLGKNLAFLFPICRACHDTVEFSKKGRKVTLDCAADRFKKREAAAKRTHLSHVLLNFDAQP